MDYPRTSKEAAEKGSKYYFTGKPCKRGHLSIRLAGHGVCMMCNAVQSAEWAEANRRKKNRTDRIYYTMNAKKICARSTEWYAENKEHASEQSRARYQENRDERLVKGREWRKQNPDKVRVHSSNAKARRKKAPGHHTVDDIAAITKAQKGRCAACGKKTKRLTVDHIIPLKKGGSNWPKNLQMLCATCNGSKNAKDPEAFMREKGFLL
jgi:5-methylcytosine-specific restriction endonuclease McrA